MKDCYEVRVIENSKCEDYQRILQKYLNSGYKIHWCDIKAKADQYNYKAILIKDNEIVGNGTDNT